MERRVSYEFDAVELDILLSGLDELVMKYKAYESHPYNEGAKELMKFLEEGL